MNKNNNTNKQQNDNKENDKNNQNSKNSNNSNNNKNNNKGRIKYRLSKTIEIFEIDKGGRHSRISRGDRSSRSKRGGGCDKKRNSRKGIHSNQHSRNSTDLFDTPMMSAGGQNGPSGQGGNGISGLTLNDLKQRSSYKGYGHQNGSGYLSDSLSSSSITGSNNRSSNVAPVPIQPIRPAQPMQPYSVQQQQQQQEGYKRGSLLVEHALQNSGDSHSVHSVHSQHSAHSDNEFFTERDHMSSRERIYRERCNILVKHCSKIKKSSYCINISDIEGTIDVNSIKLIHLTNLILISRQSDCILYNYIDGVIVSKFQIVIAIPTVNTGKILKINQRLRIKAKNGSNNSSNSNNNNSKKLKKTNSNTNNNNNSNNRKDETLEVPKKKNSKKKEVKNEIGMNGTEMISIYELCITYDGKDCKKGNKSCVRAFKQDAISTIVVYCNHKLVWLDDYTIGYMHKLNKQRQLGGIRIHHASNTHCQYYQIVENIFLDFLPTKDCKVIHDGLYSYETDIIKIITDFIGIIGIETGPISTSFNTLTHPVRSSTSSNRSNRSNRSAKHGGNNNNNNREAGGGPPKAQMLAPIGDIASHNVPMDYAKNWII